ncbi:MAG: photosystem II complex extrinsic protein PsbU [Synechococcus sp. MED-G133]|jgi:photosystem II PsbU protein|uniref:photosystem II complex extrinsic protein PsbU n=1 Tax=Synechococcus sp. A15-28 TaxID=1050638 RepID=UPI00121B6142|nr:photosystem II complex extrinsic protein PsbU [Synechococcus sp. A15-28]MBA4733779.1 photosystem II complex extrinsic protein PsbU [Synechococcus sp.]QNI43449.1 photosystem II 12 kDa extrinsic PsbU protein [Synechococcus sp. A15-28]RZO06595.1 MAG: photosystem II complex extrinsic protein PsbU [Synechococcus sp. MED-G133]|tara:strand:+ start:5725 stop:6132 length:408 start_codon:yes stop_codon:yes gene_type:complete
MKRLLSWLTGALLMAGLMAGLILPASVHADEDLVGKYSGNEIRNIADDKIAAREGKVDLNNSSVRRFQQFPGMYPTMAGKIVLGGPYNDVDEVLNLDLSERQIELFNKYKENFTVTPPEIALNEGDDRINDGQYR